MSERTERSLREVNRGDRWFRLIAAGFGALVVLTLLGIAMQTARVAWPALVRFGPGFLVSSQWDPVREHFGALCFVYGTLASSLLALALALPISLAIAIFLTELAPGWLRAPVAFVVELLAAVPSVVYGLWGVFVMTPWLRQSIAPWLSAHLGWLPLFRGPSHGLGLLSAVLILSMMILPTVSSVSREVLLAVPEDLREGGLALGATRWDVLRLVVLPHARRGILGAAVLGLGRALGETMAVTMVVGNRPEISLSLLSPAHTMASVLAGEFSEASSELHTASLAEIALLLFGITLGINALARALVARSGTMPTPTEKDAT